jgi:DNA-binding response OmpR family regulator
MAATVKAFEWDPGSGVALKTSFTGSPVVVLLEDDEDLRSLCCEVLVAAGYEVVECATLEEAYQALADLVPDVVLLDRELPDGDGLDLARWVRGFPPLDSVRIIGFSALNSRPQVAAALEAGCHAFLGKPCSPDALVQTIQAQHKPR